MMNKIRILILMGLLLTMQYGAEAQSEPDIIWHTPGVSADFLVLSPDGQYVYANRGDSKLGNVFSQLRVDDGTIIRKDVNTVGHIAGFTADGRHAIVVNLRTIKNGNKIYKVETETLEKVDSLEFEDVLSFFTAFAFSYDNKYLYLGNYGRREAADTINKDNFYVVDTENFEIIYRTHFLKTVPKTNNIQSGTILGIYPSPDNNYIALNVDAPSETSWLPVLDVRDNYKNIATNPPLEYQSNIGRAAFTLDAKKLFLYTTSSSKLFVYNLPKFELETTLEYIDDKSGNGIGKILTSNINPNDLYVSTYERIVDLQDNKTTILKIHLQDYRIECFFESFPGNPIRHGIYGFSLINNEQDLINIGLIEGEFQIYKFKNCTPTGVEDDQNKIQTLQVIDNKLTIPLEAIKGVMLNYQISDMRGVVLTQQSIISSSNELIIDVHHLAPGTYFLTLQILNETVNYKFIIIR